MKRWVILLGALAMTVTAGGFALAAGSTQDFRGDLTAPAGGDPFGGDVVGRYEIEVRNHRVEIEAVVFSAPPQGHVFEGWLVDMETGYKLSLGQLRRSSLEFEQRMVNPWTYGVLVITVEPSGDLDPNPVAPVGGAWLPAPFGQ